MKVLGFLMELEKLNGIYSKSFYIKANTAGRDPSCSWKELPIPHKGNYLEVPQDHSSTSQDCQE
jgi:hypothetical protein